MKQEELGYKYHWLLTPQEKTAKYNAIGLQDNEIQMLLAPLSKLPPEAIKPALMARDRLEKLVREENEKFPSAKKGLFYKEEESRSESAGKQSLQA